MEALLVRIHKEPDQVRPVGPEPYSELLYEERLGDMPEDPVSNFSDRVLIKCIARAVLCPGS